MTKKIKKFDTKLYVKRANILAKILLLMGFVVAIGFSLESTASKGMVQRAPLFLAPVVIIPLLHLFKRYKPYPHTGDLLITLPFLLDTYGNIFGLFDNVANFDDILHFVNWVLLVMAYLAFRYRRVNDNRDARLLGAGFGALAIIVWELIEYIVSEDGPFQGAINGLNLSYGDTVGDLVVSTGGGIVGAYLGVMLFGAAKKRLRR